MDKSVIFAVAGSGKTTLLIRRLREDSRTLILTHTRNNEAHLRAKITARYGFQPESIRVMTWFEFLYGFCCRPLLLQPSGTRGLNFSKPPQWLPRTNPLHFQDSSGRLYHRRLALKLTLSGLMPDIQQRLSRFYDELLVDEVQDFAGHDFNFLLELCGADISVLLAGDFFQHTFDTSRDGSTNSTLHHDISCYESRFRAAGVIPDHDTLSRTWRCSSTVCRFIQTQLNIPIEAQRRREAQIVCVSDPAQADALYADDSIVKLFYEQHHRYGCYSMNWGASKGLDHFQDVCIVMGNAHWRLLNQQGLSALPASSRNKLYVACSRARGSIWFVPELLMRKYRQ